MLQRIAQAQIFHKDELGDHDHLKWDRHGHDVDEKHSIAFGKRDLGKRASGQAASHQRIERDHKSQPYRVFVVGEEVDLPDLYVVFPPDVFGIQSMGYEKTS